MERMERRAFLKLAGASVGAVVLSGLFYDQLFAGMILKPGEELFASRFGVTKEVMKKVLDGRAVEGRRLRRPLLRAQDGQLGVHGGRHHQGVVRGRDAGRGHPGAQGPADRVRLLVGPLARAHAAGGAHGGGDRQPRRRDAAGVQGGRAGPAALPHGRAVRRGAARRQDRAGAGGLRRGQGPRPPHHQGPGDPRRRAAVRGHRHQRGPPGGGHPPAGALRGVGHRRGQRQARLRPRQRRRPHRHGVLLRGPATPRRRSAPAPARTRSRCSRPRIPLAGEQPVVLGAPRTPASWSTRRWATRSRPTATGARRRSCGTSSARWWRARWSRSTTTRPSPTTAAPSTWTTRARPPATSC